jgi:MFS superfamily sulfate permease-like transporter
MKNFFTRWQDDLPASVVVFFVAVPLCLGIALASGAPLFSGLIAGIIGGIVVGSISDSSLGVSGPAAGLAIIVLHAIQDLGTFEIFLVAVIIGGVIQVLLGLLKGGVIGFYFPSSVIKGMLAAIGLNLKNAFRICHVGQVFGHGHSFFQAQLSEVYQILPQLRLLSPIWLRRI